MATGLQVAGLASNFDWKSFVDQIMTLERAPADRLEAEKAVNNQKANLLGSLTTKLSALQDAIEALKAGSLFGKRSASSTAATNAWSAIAAVNTAVSSYKLAVTQLATSAELKGATNVGSALNPVSNDVSGLTVANLPLSQPVTAGDFSINGKKVTVALTDSLQDVFTNIATATGGDVTGSYDRTTDRITLTSTSGSVMLGAANDTSNFLRSMKLGNNGGGTVTSSASLGSVKPGATIATANLATPITAVDGSGNGTFTINGVSITYNVNTDTVNSVMTKINESTAGVTASYDGLNDRMVLSNKSTGDLGISVSEAAGGLLGSLGLSGGTAFTRGKNAEFTLNGGAVLTSQSNTLDSTSHGVAGLTVTATSIDTQTINVAPDTSAMRTKIDAFIKDYNSIQQFLDANTKVSTDSKGKVSSAVLASNREIQDWGRSLRTLAFGAVSGLPGSIDRLNDLGIDFTPGTSELQVKDEGKLSSALSNSTSEVEAFFTTATTGFAAKLDAFVTKISDQNVDQVKRINSSNTSIDEQVAAIERHLAQQRSLLESAFIQMENAQSKIKQQQSALDGMLAKSSS
ncbi:flagellar filament capping protein FliD [Horticoccus sp. 23ND18S-11]|uniref:flagellar filament capping protein FliD n=1 Tax=Horticoccus sp. 23ND18S-11 TaxID=3391832 RepID=UPI0039C9768D